MKRQFAIGALMAAFLSLSSLASAQITLIARLTGAEETPPVTTNARGLAILTLDASRTQLSYDLVVDGLVDITASHIHRGGAGVAGPVIYPITSGPFTYTSGTITNIPATDANNLISGNMYLNVHTAAHPGGEIRGQIEVPPAGTFAARINGAQENPPVATDARGVGLFTLDQARENINWDIILADLVGMTAAHLHRAPAGTNGPVVIPIGPTPFTATTGSAAISAELLAALQVGDLYFNAHTPDHPGGEVRGQLFTPLHDEVPDTESAWDLKLTLSADVTDASIGSEVHLGTRPDAIDGWAPGEDIQGPVRPPNDFAVEAVIHPANEEGWVNHGGLYINDVRSPINPGESETWERLFVSSDVGAPDAAANITLSWPNLSNISSALQFTLVDKNDVNKDGITTYDMRGTNNFTFKNVAGTADPVQNTEFAITVTNTRALQRPVISNLTASKVGATSITLTWTTDVASDSSVKYGTAANNLDRSISEATAGTEHSVVIAGLTPNTPYFFEVTSNAPGLNPGTATLSVTTLKTLSAVGAITATDLTETGGNLNFQTDIPATAKVFFGTDANNLTQSIDLTTAQTTQVAALSGLTAGTQYFVRIVSSAEGAEDLVQTFNFSTVGALRVNDLVIENVTGTSAKVTVNTTAPATVSIRYGTPNLATNSKVLTDNTVAATHVFNLTGLTLGATYQVQATAQLPAPPAPVLPTLTLVQGNTSSPWLIYLDPSISPTDDFSAVGADETKFETWDLEADNGNWTNHLTRKGITNANMDGWLRMHVRLPAGFAQYEGRDLLLHDFIFNAADETYFNGVLIGKTGKLPKDPGGAVRDADTVRKYTIPASAVNWTGDNVIAIHGWHDAGSGAFNTTRPKLTVAPQTSLPVIKLTQANTSSPWLINLGPTVSPTADFSAVGADESSFETWDLEADSGNWTNYLTRKGITNANMDGWLRMHLRLPSDWNTSFHAPLLLTNFIFNASDETFFNGVLIGKTGKLPKDPGGAVRDADTVRKYTIPAELVNWTGDNVIAIHGWHDAGSGAFNATRPELQTTARSAGSAQSNVATFNTLRAIVIVTAPTATVGTDNASITFSTDVNTTGSIRFGTTSSLDRLVAFNDSGRDHTVVLTGLQPNTKYFYQISLNGANRDPLLTAVQEFTTAPSVVRGDVSGDGVVTILDVQLVLEHVLGIRVLTPAQVSAGDVAPESGNQEPLDLRDVTRLLRASTGIEPL